MKFPYFKSAAVLVSAFALLNCTDDGVTPIVPPEDGIGGLLGSSASSDVLGSEACWKLNDFLIYPVGIVTDLNGNVVGSFDATTGTISSLDGTPVLDNIDVNILPVTTRDEVNSPVLSSSSNDILVPGGSSAVVVVPGSSDTPLVPVASSSSVVVPSENSSSSVKPVESSSSGPIVSGNVTVTGNLSQTIAIGSKTGEIVFSGLTFEPTRLSWNAYFLEPSYSNGTYTIKSVTVPEYFQTGAIVESFMIEGKTFELKLNITGSNGGNTNPQSSSSVKPTTPSSSSSAPIVKPSSSSVKSSSSSVKSSSSISVPTNPGLSEDLKPIPGGKSGSGWATRYWDCCKPHCAWPDKGGLRATACDVKGNKLNDANAVSMCDGGNSGTCLDQTPIIVNDNLAYAFAAVPGSAGGQCGSCFALSFTGTGKYETKGNHKALAGKKLIVIASNIGYDVAEGQFDIMIPGGGFGKFNGCAGYGWGPQGMTYGGLLGDCEKEVGYSGDVKEKRKSCLVNKCNSVFANDVKAKAGCMFLATWLEAADNPNHNFQQVECPKALLDKF